MSSSLSPEELWEKLIWLDSKGFHKTRPDLDMLREAYQRSRQLTESQAVQKAFESALGSWTTDQMREFLLRWLSEPGQLVGIETASYERLRDLLRQIYHHIFG